MKKKLLAVIAAAAMSASVIMPFSVVQAAEYNAEDIRLISDWGNASAVISWKNPAIENITSIEVIDSSGASVVPDGYQLKSGASEINGFKIDGLTNDTLYNYTVRISAGGEEYEYQTSVIPRALGKTVTSDGYDISPWQISKEKGFAVYIDNEEKYSGSSSLKISGNNISDYFNMLQDKWYGSDVYEISVMAKTDSVDGTAQILNRWDEPRVTIVGDEWRKYTFVTNNIKDPNPNPRIIVEKGCDAVWIDDLEVRKYENGEAVGDNLNRDSGFEFGVLNPMAGAKESGKLVLSWINPKNEYISDIDILNSDGESIIGDTRLLLGSRDVNSFVVEGLTDGVEYTYTILLTINGIKTSVTVKGVPVSNDMQWRTQEGFSTGSWKFAGGNNMINRYIDLNEASSGKSSVKIVSNYTPASNYGRIEREISGFDADKTYKLSFRAKLENFQAANENFQGGSKSVKYMDDWKDIGKIESGNNDWKTYTYTFSGKTKYIFRLIIETQCVFWIDDIEIYEMADGASAGDNMADGGDFEYSAEITNEMVVYKNMSAAISWKNPNEGVITSIDIFDEAGNKVNPEAAPETENGKYSRAVITLPEQNKGYKYTISVNIRNSEPIKKLISFTPIGDFNYTSQNGVKMMDMSKLKIEGETLRDVSVKINEEAKYNGKYGLSARSNTKTLTSLLFDPIAVDSSKSYRASVWVKIENMDGKVWMANDWGERTQVSGSEWTKYSFDISGASKFIFRLASEAAYTSLYADDFTLFELDSDGNEIGGNLMSNGGFEGVLGVGAFEFTEQDGVVKAEAPAYNYIQANKFEPTVILAAYNEDGVLTDVDYIEENIEVSQTKNISLEVNNDFTIKAFIWDGRTMRPLAEIVEKQ